jgi:hypothetical protein
MTEESEPQDSRVSAANPPAYQDSATERGLPGTGVRSSHDFGPPETPPAGVLATPDDPPAAVWPPAPVGQPDYANANTLRTNRMRYTPLTRLSKAYMVVLLCCAVLYAVFVYCEAAGGLTTLIAGAFVALLFIAALVVAGFLFLRWTYLAYKNLVAFGTNGLMYTPGFAVGYFFIPIVNIYKPVQVFIEIWNASDPAYLQGSSEWRKAKVPGVIPFWWLSWLIWNILSDLASKPELSHDEIGQFAAVIFFAISSILAIQVVRGITTRQEEKSRAYVL